MNYYLNLFTPETWAKFQEHGSKVSGFRYRQRRLTKEDIHEGDVFLCYLVRLSRWCGVLEIKSEAYEDSSPIFSDLDPFVIRFTVKPEVILDPQHSVPIFEDRVWGSLKETKGIAKGAPGWAKYYRGSLRQLDAADGQFLVSLLKQQKEKPVAYPITDRDKRQLARYRKVKTIEGEVTVTVPSQDDEPGKGRPFQPKPKLPTCINRYRAGGLAGGAVRQSTEIEMISARCGGGRSRSRTCLSIQIPC